MNGQLLAIQVDGSQEYVDATFEGIKRGLRGATLSFQLINDDLGMYIDDFGMLDGAHLNLAVSILVAHPIYGPAVMCAARPDGNGDSLPASESDLRSIKALAAQVEKLTESAARVGQVIEVTANPETVPAPTITAWEGFGA